MRTIFISLLVVLLNSVAASAQKGAIAGTVLDEDGFPLLGANVVIQGTTTGAQTDYVEGKYQFQPDPGTYTIEVSYIGYANKVIEGVEVTAKNTTLLDISMAEDAGVELEAVTVSAKAIERGEIAVMKLRQNSDKVQDVISSQEIQRLGAGTAAAALTKVTGTTVVDGKYVYVRGLGDRYSATTVNGLRLPSIDPYRNSAQLDLIPTNLLDNIVASKTFTPDLPGDFTGGSVNIKLKALPERFAWGISASSSYNPQGNLSDNFQTFDAGSQAWLGFNDGSLDRPAIFENPRLGEIEALTDGAARRARGDDELAGLLDQAANAWAPGGFTPRTKNTPLDYSLSVNLGNQFQLGAMPVGVFGTLSYGREYSQYENGTRANYFNPGQEEVLFRDFDLVDNRSVESAKIGGLFGLSLRPSPANTINLYSIYSHQGFLDSRELFGANDNFGVAGTEESFFRTQTQGFLERELIDYVVEGEHTLTGMGNTKIEWAANYVDSEQNEPDLRFLAYTQENDFAQINPAQLLLPSRFYRDLSDDSYQGKIDVTVPFLQAKSRGNALKFGGLYNRKERDFNESTYIYSNRRGQGFGEVMADPDRYFAPENLGVIGGEPGRNEIGLYIQDNTRLANSYVGTYDIAAAYGMVTYEVTERLKVIAGARLESTTIDIESDQAAVALNPEEFRANIDTTALLPALNLVYKAGENSNLRASFSQTIARPNMREIAPFGSFGFIGDPPVFGNPDLQLTNIDNYDLRFEIFPRAGEVLAVSAFYKKFRNPIVVTFRNAGEQQFTWTNSERADLYGVELEFRKSLGFLSEQLDNFTFSSNFSYIESSQSIDADEVAQGRELDPEFKAERRFNGQSPVVINANLGYSAPESGWDAMIAYNYFGDRLQSIGAVGSSDIFERGRAGLDLSVSKKINNFNVSLRGRNLLNPRYETFSEFRGTEYIFNSYERGREISLGVGYGF